MKLGAFFTRRRVAAAALIFGAMALRATLLPVGHATTVHEPRQQGYFDYRGIIHYHTGYSGDATGTFEDIARVANEQGVDFMISTDHNTLKPLDDGKEHWYGKTLFLVGMEVTRPEGYLLALDVKHFAGRDDDAKTPPLVRELKGQGGMLLVAHPEHPKSHWRGADPGVDGMEILDCADQLQQASPATLATAVAYYPFNTAAGWMSLYQQPDDALAAWDEKTLKRSQVGIYAPDFHQAVRIGGGIRIPFPPASAVMPIAHDHALLSTAFSGELAKDKELLYDALRRGHLFFSMDILQDATGFFFSAREGGRTAWMGDRLPGGGPVDFTVTLPPDILLKAPRIHVYRDGREISSSGESRYNFTASDKGAYRVEVEVETPTFWGSGRRMTWIFSNPIYVGPGSP